MRHDRTIQGLICSAVIIVSACSSAAGPSKAPASGGTAAATSAPTTHARASASPASRAWPVGAPDAWLLVGRSTDASIHVIQASTGEAFLDMPNGAAARPDWLHEIATTSNGTKTTVSDVIVQPGLGGTEVAIDGAWRLPTIGYDPTPVGLSADGSTAVLVEANPAPAGGASVSRFAILKIAPLKGPGQIVELRGSFEYDAISSDGRVLYLVEHLAGTGGAYQVRAIDLPAGTMREGIIADKRNLGEAMAGWPIGQVRSPDGPVFTLYNGLQHPFIHALNTTEGWAVCIDLPATANGTKDAALQWGLAASSDGRTLYATNAGLGVVSEVDMASQSLSRSGTLGSVGDAGRPIAAAGPAITLAKFGHQEGGPVGRRTIVAPDGKTAYAAGPDGILAIRTSDLTLASRLLQGSSVDGLGMTPDGRAIFAVLHDGGRIVAVDAATGTVIGQVPGAGFDRLLAVVPW